MPRPPPSDRSALGRAGRAPSGPARPAPAGCPPGPARRGGRRRCRRGRPLRWPPEAGPHRASATGEAGAAARCRWSAARSSRLRARPARRRSSDGGHGRLDRPGRRGTHRPAPLRTGPVGHRSSAWPSCRFHIHTARSVPLRPHPTSSPNVASILVALRADAVDRPTDEAEEPLVGDDVHPAVARAAALRPDRDLVGAGTGHCVRRGVAVAQPVDRLVLGHPGHGNDHVVAVDIGGARFQGVSTPLCEEDGRGPGVGPRLPRRGQEPTE